ncbi:diacylglycerol kinase [Skermania sp. ID1734]|uniref:diacylglycerol kinase n=1 Tax=Skermania sp. ID1734 TaxID=2597516 RepID=UPI00118163D1|nr:diacylglycerol kinase [Skermania sp. ID1734]TSE00173.1 diacylglycerol kinase [Skermania sp. ID1734]
MAVVTNPKSGLGRGSDNARAAVARLRERGADVRELAGSSAAESTRLARAAVVSGVDAVVAVGGDGLISTVLPALAESDVPLGLIPSGTGDDLARELGVPRSDPAAAADLVLDGKTRAIDLGRAGDRWFATVLASGFDSKVTDRANSMSWPRGRMRYNVAILAELGALRAIPYRLEIDGREIELDATMVSIGNTRSYGGGMLVCPDADPADGRLDVTVVGATSLVRLVRLMPTIYKGTHVHLDGVQTFRARKVRLSAPGITAYADGEPMGALPMTVSAAPAALQVITGP